MCGDAKVHPARHAIVVDQDIVWLEITVNDACRVGMGNRIENRMEDGYGFYRSQAAADFQVIAEIFSGYELKDEIDIPLLFSGFEDGNDTRMAQLADQACLG